MSSLFMEKFKIKKGSKKVHTKCSSFELKPFKQNICTYHTLKKLTMKSSILLMKIV